MTFYINDSAPYNSRFFRYLPDFLFLVSVLLLLLLLIIILRKDDLIQEIPNVGFRCIVDADSSSSSTPVVATPRTVMPSEPSAIDSL